MKLKKYNHNRVPYQDQRQAELIKVAGEKKMITKTSKMGQWETKRQSIIHKRLQRNRPKPNEKSVN